MHTENLSIDFILHFISQEAEICIVLFSLAEYYCQCKIGMNIDVLWYLNILNNQDEIPQYLIVISEATKW